MEWKNFYRGFIMGSIEVVPGISGGTIAVLLGIYEQLIGAIGGFFSKDWKKHLVFLAPLGIGMVIAIFSFAKVIGWLFENYPIQTQFFFRVSNRGHPLPVSKGRRKNKISNKALSYANRWSYYCKCFGNFKPE